MGLSAKNYGVIAAGFMATTALNSAAFADSTSVFTGVDVGENGYTLYLGGVTALNRDIDSSGVVLRFSTAYGEYDYRTVASPTGKVDSDNVSADIMVGYQWISDAMSAAVYVGADYQDVSLSPLDPNNSTEGDEFGAKVQFELFSRGGSMPGSSLIANYSSANESYYVRGRLGFSVGPVHIGPEIAAMGNEEYDQQRYGLFVGGIKLGQSTYLTLNAGYAEGSGNASDGAYGGIGLSVRF